MPPDDTVLIIWCHDFTREHADTADAQLVPLSAISTVERPMFIGDIVRLSPDDPRSGTIVAVSVDVSVMNPRPWLAKGDTTYPSLHRSGRLDNIPMIELADTLGFTAGQVIVYKDWIGRIIEYMETFQVRLSDGSVVELADPDDIENASFLGEDGALVGDFIQTKKGNLRRGRYIYGTYNPNTPAQGYVVAITVQEAEIKWLHAMLYGDGRETSEMPPPSLLREELESDDCFLYDRSVTPAPGPRNAHTKRFPDTVNIDVGVGDKMRFRDVEQAKRKYAGHINFFDRRRTNGYDVNVFTVYRTHTRATVQWQDLSLSTHHTVDLLPSADLDDGTEVWPGELVMLRKPKDPRDKSTFEPQGVGIVQSVRTRDRLARVKWFEGSVFFATDDHTEVLPGTWTGALKDDDPDRDDAGTGGEDVSMYDLWTTSVLSRRIGDIVVLDDPQSEIIDQKSERYADVFAMLASPREDYNWLGEIVEVSLHGWLVVRLGASKTCVRDICVPWECTLLACGHEEEDGLSWTSSESESDLDSMYSADLDGTPWRDENNQVVNAEDGQAGWETDDDDEGAAARRDADGDTAMEDASRVPSAATPGPAAVAHTASSQGHNGKDARLQSAKFAFEGLFPEATGPASFTVLEGLPTDHHYLTTPTSSDNKRLRRIQKEYSILQDSLPPGVYVRTWEGNMSLLRILILGPLGTPYEYAPFLIDMHLGDSFPTEPPSAFFHSWTDGSGPVNPNLYEDGKICLSLLGTWPGHGHDDTWSPKSTVLQVIVSLLGLVLVKEPWYNEAGFDVRAGTVESKTPSALYSERVYLRTREFLLRALDLAEHNEMSGLDDVVKLIYTDTSADGPQLLRRAVAHIIGVSNRSLKAYAADRDVYADAARSETRTVSAGAVRSLESTTRTIIQARADGSDSVWLGLGKLFAQMMETKEPVEVPQGPLAEYIEESGG